MSKDTRHLWTTDAECPEVLLFIIARKLLLATSSSFLAPNPGLPLHKKIYNAVAKSVKLSALR